MHLFRDMNIIKLNISKMHTSDGVNPETPSMP